MTQKKKLTPGKDKNLPKASAADLQKQEQMMEDAVADLVAPTEEPDRPVADVTEADFGDMPVETPPLPPVEERDFVTDDSHYSDPDLDVPREGDVTLSATEWSSMMATMDALKARLDAKEALPSYMEQPQHPPSNVPQVPTGNLTLGTEKDPLFPEEYEHTLSHDDGTNRWILRTVHVQLPTSKGLKEQEWVSEPSEQLVREVKKRHMEILTMKFYDELKTNI